MASNNPNMEKEQDYSELLEAYIESLEKGEKFNLTAEADEELQQVLSLARLFYQQTHTAPEPQREFIERVRQHLPAAQDEVVEEGSLPTWSWVSVFRFAGVGFAALVLIVGVVTVFLPNSGKGAISQVSKPLRTITKTLTNTTPVASNSNVNNNANNNNSVVNTNTNNNSTETQPEDTPKDEDSAGDSTIASNDNKAATTADDVIAFTELDLSALGDSSESVTDLLDGLSADFDDSVNIATDVQLATMSNDLDFSLEN